MDLLSTFSNSVLALIALLLTWSVQADHLTHEEIFAELQEKKYCGNCHQNADYMEVSALQDPELKRLLYDRLRWLEVKGHQPANGKIMPMKGTSQHKNIQKKENKEFVQDLIAAVKTDLQTEPIGSEKLRETIADHIKLPEGFKVALYAVLPGARSMVLSDRGTLFVGTGGLGSPMNVVYALRDKNKNLQIEDSEIHIFSQDLENPNGVAFKNGDLYVAERNKLRKFPNIDTWLDENDSSKKYPMSKTEIIMDFPEQQGHSWKYARFSPHDGHLYLPIGYPGNIGPELDDKSIIYKINVESKTKEVVARGIRNSVGLDFHKSKNEIWFTDNGRDQLGNEQPKGELNRMALPISNGAKPPHFGFPYCHTMAFSGAPLKDPSYNKGRDCKDFQSAEVGLQAHAAGLGLRFYNNNHFPEKYQGHIFIAERGSWNRTSDVDHTGNRITFVKHKTDGDYEYEVFAEGWLLEDPKTGLKRDRWGRPVDVEVLGDGSLIVSDSGTRSSLLNMTNAGALYRIWYSPQSE